MSHELIVVAAPRGRIRARGMTAEEKRALAPVQAYLEAQSGFGGWYATYVTADSGPYFAKITFTFELGTDRRADVTVYESGEIQIKYTERG